MFHKEKVTLGHRRKRPRGIITPEVDDVEIELVTINGHTAVMKCLSTCTMTTTCVTTETKNINFFHTDFGAHSLIV